MKTKILLFLNYLIYSFCKIINVNYNHKFILSIDKDIVSKIRTPRYVIGVCDINRNSKILIEHLLINNGFKIKKNVKKVNSKKDYLDIILNVFNSFYDVLLFEIKGNIVNEKFYFTHLVLNNLNNNISINKDVHLVINVDDVLINHIGIQHKGSLTTYGLNETRFSYKKSKETVICPKCNQNLKYNYYHYNNYGDFECKCGFKRLDPMFLATNVNLNKLTIKVNNSVLKIDKDSYNSIYRSLLAFTFGNVINIPKEKIINCINSIPVNYSNQIYKIDNRNVKIIDNKNSNAVSFEQSMEFVMRHHGEKTIILGIDDNKKNTSLLWDFDFENLDTLSIDKIICIGKHKWDVATRLMYAGIPEDKLIILSDINSLLEITKKDSKGDIFLMFYYDVLNSYS